MKAKMDPRKKTLLIAGVAAIALTGITAGAVQADSRWHERGGRHEMMGGPGMMGGHGMMGGGRDIIRHLADEADADEDGKLTQAEIDAAQTARFEKFDADKDGKVSKAEFMAAGKSRYEDADTDKDGEVTPWEFRSQHRG